MKVHIKGVFEFDPFGIPMLKHNSNVDQSIDIGTGEIRRYTLPIGPLTLGVAIDIEGDKVIADVKLALLNTPLYDLKETLVNHIGTGPVNIGSKQLGFIGVIEVLDN